MIFLFVGMKVEAIYEEIFTEILESLGFDVSDELDGNVTSAENSTINSEYTIQMSRTR